MRHSGLGIGGCDFFYKDDAHSGKLKHFLSLGDSLLNMENEDTIEYDI